MDDYIKREEAIRICNMPNYNIHDILFALKTIPGKMIAADVRENVRGSFVGDYDGYADGNPVHDIWSCSNCGVVFEDWDEKPTYNFCPYCGADMRGEKDG